MKSLAVFLSVRCQVWTKSFYFEWQYDLMNWNHSLTSPPTGPVTAFRSSVAPHLETMRSSSSLPSSSHPTSSTSPAPQPPPSSLSVFRLLFHLLVFCPYFITTGLLLSIYLDRISATRSGRYLYTGASLWARWCVSLFLVLLHWV